MIKCDRCERVTDSHTTSFFNTDTICMPCAKEECTFPEYTKAKEREREEVLKGNFNFEGIGLPEKYVEMYRQRREQFGEK